MTQKQNEVALMLINYNIGGSLKWECLLGSSLSASVATRLVCAIRSAWEALSLSYEKRFITHNYAKRTYLWIFDLVRPKSNPLGDR